MSVSVWQCPANGPVWGTGGPEFKSRRSDQLKAKTKPGSAGVRGGVG